MTIVRGWFALSLRLIAEHVFAGIGKTAGKRKLETSILRL